MMKGKDFSAWDSNWNPPFEPFWIHSGSHSGLMLSAKSEETFKKTKKELTSLVTSLTFQIKILQGDKQ